MQLFSTMCKRNWKISNWQGSEMRIIEYLNEFPAQLFPRYCYRIFHRMHHTRHTAAIYFYRTLPINFFLLHLSYFVIILIIFFIEFFLYCSNYALPKIRSYRVFRVEWLSWLFFLRVSRFITFLASVMREGYSLVSSVWMMLYGDSCRSCESMC